WSTSKTPSYTKSVSWQHHPEKDNIKVNPVIMPTIVEAYAFPTLITGKIMSVYMSLLYFFLTFMLPTNRSVRDVIDVAITSIAARE
ncbi:hypothetical protein, partial [Enterobacter hormaechei]|uniref:hypothetical protein n=1 Tax=Enterobacter hormaechei TaxID=158836 RepID=UPI001BE12BB2